MSRINAPEEDRRVRRTKKLLREALVTLTLARGWDKTSVTDVCERADVGRSTFYLHFADKEDLLLSGFDDLHHALASHPHAGNEPFSFALALVTHAEENTRLYRALVGRKSGHAVQRRFRDTVIKVIAGELVGLGVPKADRHAVATFLGGGFAEMLLSWLDQPSREDAARLALRFRTLALSATGHSVLDE